MSELRKNDLWPATAARGIRATPADMIDATAVHDLHARISGSAASAVARVYNQSQQLKPRAAVLDHWAALVTQESADVVRIAS